jgi:hypothetical protein
MDKVSFGDNKEFAYRGKLVVTKPLADSLSRVYSR